MIHSIALSLLLGFELSYYLLILQTGLVAHYNSDLVVLAPMFIGGVFGTIIAGRSWGSVLNPTHKIIIALSLQLILSFFYPFYNTFTLLLLGIVVGVMAPLGIYLFKVKQSKELVFALAIAYSIGTYCFSFDVENRLVMAVMFSSIGLFSAMMLRDYKVEIQSKTLSHSFVLYFPLILWILLDSKLFETLLRDTSLNIWSSHTISIIIFHLFGLIVASYLHTTKVRQHTFIAILFSLSYMSYFLEMSAFLAIIYPFTISYYNIVVFKTLSEEVSLVRLSFIMVLVGWAASGIGLGLALL